MKIVSYLTNLLLSSTPVIVDYPLNDPMWKMVRQVALPPQPRLQFSIAGYKGEPAPLSTLQGQANTAYVTLAASLNYIQNYADIKKWAATYGLRVYPRAGEDLNAYYDRSSLKFFYARVRGTPEVIFTVNSSDIVAHELGHAVLDAIRPDFWSVQSMEIEAFHESFADINAMVTTMQFEDVLETVLAETKGNLRVSNGLSRLAEQLGVAVYQLTRGATLPWALRDAVNSFKYVAPESLPAEAPDNELCNECHSFGRVFMGIWYDILCGIYEKEKSKGAVPLVALKTARDRAFSYLVRAATQAPCVPRYHEAVATVMLNIDAQAGKPYQDVLKMSFGNKGIRFNNIRMLTDMHRDDVDGAYDSIKFGNAALVKDKKTIRVSNILAAKKDSLGALAVGKEDISTVEVEVACDKYFQFDKSGRVIEAIIPSDDEVMDAAHARLMTIKDIGPKSMWNIQGNKLTRQYIV
jgi:hypothetical protein